MSRGFAGVQRGVDERVPHGVGSDGRNTWLIWSFGAGVRRMKRPITWRKNSSVRAVVA